MRNIFQSIRIPKPLASYIFYNYEERSTRQQRRQLTLNIVSIWGAANSLTFAVYYYWTDPSLWPGSIACVFLAASLFVLPFVSRLGEVALSVFATVTVCGSFVYLTYLLGVHSGVYLYILTVPPALVIVVGPEWLATIVLSTVVSIGCVLFSALYVSEPALPAATLPAFQIVLLSMALVIPIAMVTVATYFAFLRADRAEDALEAEHARSEELLYNLLPEAIAARLKVEPNKTIADSLPEVAILFADIVNFTPRSANMTPEETVKLLNRTFSAFDELAEKHGSEKIKSIGDAYMVAAGIPNPCKNPVKRLADMALDMLEVTRGLSAKQSDELEVRIGLHAGPAIAGVIGSRKPFYDVWGETVNVASRMESHGEPGQIQVTEAVHSKLADEYSFSPRGKVKIKGMGLVKTWWLKAPLASA